MALTCSMDVNVFVCVHPHQWFRWAMKVRPLRFYQWLCVKQFKRVVVLRPARLRWPLKKVNCLHNTSHFELMTCLWYVFLFCLWRSWTLHQSLCFGQCLVKLCTQPFQSSMHFEGQGAASCLCHPTGKHRTINIKSIQVCSLQQTVFCQHWNCLRQLYLTWNFPTLH